MNIEKKIWPEYFDKIISGDKKFELRLADFEVDIGDNLVLKEFNPITNDYTGRMMIRQVLSVTKFGFKEIENLKNYEVYSIDQLKKFGVYKIN